MVFASEASKNYLGPHPLPSRLPFRTDVQYWRPVLPRLYPRVQWSKKIRENRAVNSLKKKKKIIITKRFRRILQTPKVDLVCTVAKMIFFKTKYGTQVRKIKTFRLTSHERDLSWIQERKGSFQLSVVIIKPK